jgi:hypothetical protein
VKSDAVAVVRRVERFDRAAEVTVAATPGDQYLAAQVRIASDEIGRLSIDLTREQAERLAVELVEAVER